MEFETKSGYAVMLGRPNVGKSTLMNHLIGQKIAITSHKPQTTRNRILTVYTDDRGQVIFLDTPGVQKAKNKLGEFMADVTDRTLGEADVVMFLVEPSANIGPNDQKIAERLKGLSGKRKVILVINKADTVDSELIKKTVKAWEEMEVTEHIVTVSALKDQNTKALMDKIFELLPYGPLYYDEDTVTEEPMRDIAAEMIREKALRLLRDEIPHGIAVEIIKMRTRPDGCIMDIEANVICERESHKGMIIGKGGSMLKKIGSAARTEIEEMTECQVNLQLFVKVRKEWRDDDAILKGLGYKK
ncbi:MAG: GTPase Era [Lachnospiraceae bacterium]|nr:GTPase Era [Lachnospiraceae bacterium]